MTKKYYTNPFKKESKHGIERKLKIPTEVLPNPKIFKKRKPSKEAKEEQLKI
mgnify:CR=1 FL=1